MPQISFYSPKQKQFKNIKKNYGYHLIMQAVNPEGIFKFYSNVIFSDI